MKEFMLIFLGPTYSELNLSPEQMQERMGKWWAWQGKMEEAGILGNGHALHPSVKRISGADRIVSDGPFAESKELVGGYYIVKARDIDDAIDIARDYPDFDLSGSVEVREVMVFEQ